MAHRKDQVEMQYAAPPVRSLWPPPPRWPEEPVNDWGDAEPDTALIYAESATDLPDERDDITVCDDTENDGEANWLANLARMLVFTVLLVALLVVSMVLSHSAGWLADHDITLEPAVRGQRPLSVGLAVPEARGSAVADSQTSRGASPRPGEVKTGGTAQLRETTSLRSHVMTKVASDVIQEEDVSTEAHVLYNPERPGIKSRQCGDHFFSLCPKSKQEFYFRASQRASFTAATKEVVAVCNWGPNRFRSHKSCSDTCGGDNSEPTSQRVPTKSSSPSAERTITASFVTLST